MKLGYEIDEAYEFEFAAKCEEITMYQHTERTTLDGEWTEEELKSDIYDVCIETMTDTIIDKYKFRAIKDNNLLNHYYMSEHILNQVGDVIEFYNKEYDKHRNENKFGIIWYDDAIKRIIMKSLKENLV